MTTGLETGWVTLPNGEVPLNAYLASPAGRGPYPAILVLQEVFGVNTHIRDVTERVARLGYVALAPSLFHRTAPGFEVGYSDTDLALGRYHKDQTQAAQLLGDLQAALAYLKTLPQVRPAGFGVMGFCFGGHVAYLAATLPDVIATASFYGAGISTFTPGGGPPTLTRTAAIHGRIWLFFGTQDPLIPQEHVTQIEAELQRCQADYRLFTYDAGHGFLCDQRDSYRPAVAAEAWQAVQHLFQGTLGVAAV